MLTLKKILNRMKRLIGPFKLGSLSQILNWLLIDPPFSKLFRIKKYLNILFSKRLIIDKSTLNKFKLEMVRKNREIS